MVPKTLDEWNIDAIKHLLAQGDAISNPLKITRCTS
jgi:hypothetical protein